MSTATSSTITATSNITRTHHHPSSSSSTAQSATQACAVCKYQRRKCNPDCTLAPYFPADQQRQFLNAHRLFGVSNILKIIRHVDPLQRAEAMHSIIFQSNARAHDPVGGCYRIILELERQLEHDSAELALVLRQLAICRSQQAQAALSPAGAPDHIAINPNLILSTTGDVAAGDAIYGNHLPMQQQPQQYYNYNFYYDGGGDNPSNEHHNNNHSMTNSNSINNINNHHNNYDNAGVEMELPTSSMLSLHPQQCRVEEEAVKPLADMFEVRQAFTIGDEEEESAKNFAAAAAEPLQCSGKIDLKEELNPIEDVPEHDLKGAASLFTLTNCTSSSI